jgi:hypothetical protein
MQLTLITFAALVGFAFAMPSAPLEAREPQQWQSGTNAGACRRAYT